MDLLALDPGNPHLLNGMGMHLHKADRPLEAARCFRQLLNMAAQGHFGKQPQAVVRGRAVPTACGFVTSAQDNLRDVVGGAVDRWHFRMLNDHVRNRAYQVCAVPCVSLAHDSA